MSVTAFFFFFSCALPLRCVDFLLIFIFLVHEWMRCRRTCAWNGIFDDDIVLGYILRFVRPLLGDGRANTESVYCTHTHTLHREERRRIRQIYASVCVLGFFFKIINYHFGAPFSTRYTKVFIPTRTRVLEENKNSLQFCGRKSRCDGYGANSKSDDIIHCIGEYTVHTLSPCISLAHSNCF